MAVHNINYAREFTAASLLLEMLACCTKCCICSGQPNHEPALHSKSANEFAKGCTWTEKSEMALKYVPAANHGPQTSSIEQDSQQLCEGIAVRTNMNWH